MFSRACDRTQLARRLSPQGLSRANAARLWIVAAALWLASPALAEKLSVLPPVNAVPGNEARTALVIGNSAYTSAPLKNPARDARAIARALSEDGFAVTLIEDASLAGMRRAIREFGSTIARGGIGLFYYAGHGIQVQGKNYLVPVNADIQAEDEIEDQAVDANFVLAKMDTARNSVNVMILDACRNNPFARSFRSASHGLAQMDAPSGTIIGFATAPGSVASDGEGENGLYTSYLLRAIREPGVPIEQVFKNVRIGVTRETSDRQVPWESSSLKGDFYFVPRQVARRDATPGPDVQSAVEQARKEERERAAADRERIEADMRAMVQEMVAKQRAEIEEEARKQRAALAPANAGAASSTPAALPASAPAPKATAAVTPQPVQVATLAPAPATAGPPASTSAASSTPAAVPAPAPAPRVAGPVTAPPVQIATIPPSPATAGPAGASGLPAIGDRWQYRYRTIDELTRTASPWALVPWVRVKGVADNAIVDARDNGTDVVYAPQVSITLVASSTFVLSPYLVEQQPLKVGDSWTDIPFHNAGNCSVDPAYQCKFSAKVVAFEPVTVPAGTFDAYRIEMNQEVNLIAGMGRGAAGYIVRQGTIWMAPSAKRFVKLTWATKHGVWRDPASELELNSAELK